MAYKFIKTPDENGHRTISVEFEAVTVEEMLEAFEDFLCGSGFAKYNIEVVEEPELNEDEE